MRFVIQEQPLRLKFAHEDLEKVWTKSEIAKCMFQLFVVQFEKLEMYSVRESNILPFIGNNNLGVTCCYYFQSEKHVAVSCV